MAPPSTDQPPSEQPAHNPIHGPSLHFSYTDEQIRKRNNWLQLKQGSGPSLMFCNYVVPEPTDLEIKTRIREGLAPELRQKLDSAPAQTVPEELDEFVNFVLELDGITRSKPQPFGKFFCHPG